MMIEQADQACREFHEPLSQQILYLFFNWLDKLKTL